MEWKNIYTLPRRVTINMNLRMFQYNLLHNILYLNKMLYKFGKKGIPTLLFLYGRIRKPNSPFSFLHKNKLSLDVAIKFSPKCINNSSNNTTERHLSIYWYKVIYHLVKDVLLIFKYYIYKTRENDPLDLKVLKRNIHKIKFFENQINLNKPEKRKKLEK